MIGSVEKKKTSRRRSRGNNTTNLDYKKEKNERRKLSSFCLMFFLTSDGVATEFVRVCGNIADVAKRRLVLHTEKWYIKPSAVLSATSGAYSPARFSGQ